MFSMLAHRFFCHRIAIKNLEKIVAQFTVSCLTPLGAAAFLRKKKSTGALASESTYYSSTPRQHEKRREEENWREVRRTTPPSGAAEPAKSAARPTFRAGQPTGSGNRCSRRKDHCRSIEKEGVQPLAAAVETVTAQLQEASRPGYWAWYHAPGYASAPSGSLSGVAKDPRTSKGRRSCRR